MKKVICWLNLLAVWFMNPFMLIDTATERKKGFTLIELLIVIAIILILVAVITQNIGKHPKHP